MHPLYTIGYAGWSPAGLAAEVRRVGARVIDIRMARRSRSPQWSAEGLRALLGAAYLFDPNLGNVNYANGGPILLAHPERSVKYIGGLLQREPLILLCGCLDWETCHRRTAAEYLAGAIPGVGVVHLDHGDRRKAEQ